VEQACDCIRQAALGLQHAFQHGLVHRDIKPSNLLLTHKGGVVKILDLGLARYDESLIDERGGHLTQMGRLVGTPDFMAPEQARNARSADIRADLYSLGCTFYYLLTGRPPFPEGTTVEKILKHQSSAPVPVSQLRSDVPPGVTAILDRLLAKSPAERYQTPAELVKALDAVRHATPPPKPAVPLAAPVVAAPVSDSMAFAVDPPLPTLRSPPRPRPARTAPGWFGVRVRVGAAIAGLVLFLALVTWAAWPRGTEQGRKLPPPSPAGSARSGGDRR
jgi:serine/threonine-protein kinase